MQVEYYVHGTLFWCWLSSLIWTATTTCLPTINLIHRCIRKSSTNTILFFPGSRFFPVLWDPSALDIFISPAGVGEFELESRIVLTPRMARCFTRTFDFGLRAISFLPFTRLLFVFCNPETSLLSWNEVKIKFEITVVVTDWTVVVVLACNCGEKQGENEELFGKEHVS